MQGSVTIVIREVETRHDELFHLVEVKDETKFGMGTTVQAQWLTLWHATLVD